MTILDDEPRVVIDATTTVDEDQSSGQTQLAEVRIVDRYGGSATPTEAISLEYSTTTDPDATHAATGTIDASGDFTTEMPTSTYGAGISTPDLFLTVNDDNLDEYDETFVVSLTGTSPNLHLGAFDADTARTQVHSSVMTSSVVTITDNDPLPMVSVADRAAAEGTNLAFTVSLDEVSGRNVAVQYTTEAHSGAAHPATAGGSSDSSRDFTTKSGTVTVTAGRQSATVTVATFEDALDEYDETMKLRLTGAQDSANNTVGDISSMNGTATGTIDDDDPLPSVSIDNTDTNEDGDLTFTVRLGAVSGRDVPVQYRTKIPISQVSGLQPADAADFAAVTNGEVTIEAGGRTAEATVTVTDDALDEYREFVLLVISGVTDAGGVDVGAPRDSDHADTATDAGAPRGVIIDNDDPPVVSIAAASASEGDDVVFTVSLDAESGRDVVVNYRTVIDSNHTYPAQQTDFTRVASGSVTVTEGATTATVEVATVEDDVDEYDQTFVVELTGIPGSGENQPGTISATQGAATGTIRDDDDPPALTLAPVELREDAPGGEAELTITLVHAAKGTAIISEKPISVERFTVEASDAAVDAAFPPPDPDLEPARTQLVRTERKAIAGADYTAATVTVQVAPGTGSVGFAVAVTDDDLDEYEELFTVGLRDPQDATVHSEAGAASVQINDDDPLPTLVAAAAPATEADTAVVFTVGLDAPSGRTVNVPYSTADLTQARLSELTGLSCANPGAFSCTQAREHGATAGADYTATADSIVFGPLADGATQTTKTISVAVAPDGLDEYDEMFQLAFDPDLAQPHEPVAGTVIDDDDEPTLFIPNSPRADPRDSQFVAISGVAVESEAVVTLQGELSAPSGRTASVQLRTLSGNKAFAADPTWPTPAQAGRDFIAVANARWAIPPGDTTASFEIEVLDDADIESYDEYFVAVLSGAQHLSLLAKDRQPTEELQVLLEARDDDRDPLLAMQGATVNEDSGTATVYVGFASTVTNARESFTVTCTTFDRTAAAGSDYVAVNAAEVHLSTAAVSAQVAQTPLPQQAQNSLYSSRVKAITVTINADTTSENDEQFVIDCTAASIQPPRTASAVVTINDTSDLPTISLTPATVTRREAAATIPLTATLSQASAREVSVHLSVGGGNATAGSDYRIPTGNAAAVRFAPGATTAAVEIQILDDEAVEEDETFTVTLANPTNANLGAAASSTVTITDNEGDPALSITDSSAREGGATLTFTVALAPESGQEVTVDYATTDRSATAGEDYTATTGTLTFAAGETAQTITVEITDDDTLEGDEFFAVTLANPANARISLTRGAAIGTIRDNERPIGGASTGPIRGNERPSGGGGGGPQETAPADTAGFVDVDPGSVHAANIDALAAAGITRGCATQPLRFCPGQPVTRAQMATFLTRALDLAPANPAGFVDVDPGSVHAANIDALRSRRHHKGLRYPTPAILPRPARHTSPNGDLPHPRPRPRPRQPRRIRRRRPRQRPRCQHRRPRSRRHHKGLRYPTPAILPRPARHTSPNGDLPHPRPRPRPRQPRRIRRRRPRQRPRCQHRRPRSRRHHKGLRYPTPAILPRPARHTSPNGDLPHPRPRPVTAPTCRADHILRATRHAPDAPLE